jgi:hypothetical protein
MLGPFLDRQKVHACCRVGRQSQAYVHARAGVMSIHTAVIEENNPYSGLICYSSSFTILGSVLGWPFGSSSKSLLMSVMYSFSKESCPLLHWHICTYFTLMPHISLILMVLLRIRNHPLFFIPNSRAHPSTHFRILCSSKISNFLFWNFVEQCQLIIKQLTMIWLLVQ